MIDYRDPKQDWDFNEGVRTFGWVSLMLLLFFLALAYSAGASTTPRKVTDATICAGTFDYYVQGEKDVVAYCVGLMKRGL